MGIGISAIIPVREGSTRLKHKNILPFGECNLLIHKIRQLKKVAGIDEIIVSSDSELMLEMARSEGVATHRRAREFADERTKSFSELIEHLASEVGSGEHILYAPCVCPLCDEKDLANAIEVYQERVLGSKPACDITESRESKPMDWGSVCSPRFNNGGASGDPLSTSDSNLPQNLAYRKDVCLERLDDALTPNDTLDSKKSFVCSRSGASGDPLFTSGSNLPQANCNKMTGSREFDSVISVRSFKEYLWDSFKPINYRTGVHHTPSQNLPEYFVVVNGFYLAARENMRKWRYFFGARPYLVCLPQAHAIDIDTEFDYICAMDKYAQNGSFDNQYFIQDIWGARKVCEDKPEIHYDVGSSVAGFIAHLLGMKQKIQLIDIRPMQNDLNTRFLNSGGGALPTISQTPRILTISNPAVSTHSPRFVASSILA